MRWRTVWVRTHLYLGLILGPVFVVLGRTGSIIAFRPELDEWLNADLMGIEEPLAGGPRASLDDLVATARQAMPSQGRAYALVFPRTSNGVFYVTYSLPAPTLANPRQLEWHQVFMHPGTAAVIGQRLILDLARP